MKFAHITILSLLLLAVVYTTANPIHEDLPTTSLTFGSHKPRDKQPRAKIVDHIPATEILPLPVSVETVDGAPNSYLVKSSLYSTGYENYGMLRCLHNIYVSRIRIL